METLVQISIIIVAMAVVTMAVMAVRLFVRIDRLTTTLTEGIERSKGTSMKIGELLGTLEQIALSVRGIAKRTESVVDRAAALTSDVLEEVERPVRRTAAILQGVRAGAEVLMQRWARRERPTHSGAIQEGGNGHA